METGTEISPFYDSLIAKLMVHGRTREDAIQKMQRALASTKLGGIPTNLEYLKAILAAEGYSAGAPSAAHCPFVQTRRRASPGCSWPPERNCHGRGDHNAFPGEPAIFPTCY